jgi:hypothetical protein
MTIEVGKRYSCSEYFLMFYPDKDTAGAYHGVCATDARADAVAVAAYWTRELGKPVSYCNPLTPLLVLSVNEKYVEVLAQDKRGWIINEDWLKIKEITDDAT